MYNRKHSPELRTVKLVIESGFIIEISGNYTKGEPDTYDTPGTGDWFEFTHMEIVEGDLLDLFFWARTNTEEDIENLCLESIRKDDF